MKDYEQLYKRLWQEVQKHEGELGASSQAFLIKFVKQLQAKGWELSTESIQQLNDYLTGVHTLIKAGITTAISVTTGHAMQSPVVLIAMEQAFNQRWPDGLNLSQRLWNFDRNTRVGIEGVLRAGIAQSESANTLIYDMQRAIERSNAGTKFTILSRYNSDDWAAELYSTAKNVIHNPKDRALWQKAINDVREHINKLSTTGTRNAAEQLFKQITEAVNTGNAQLLDSSLNWWVYDKQLYQLKRIVRTEMANAAHQAVINTTIDDVTVIGYQWRLSGSHPAGSSCVCSQYANVEMGLGKGVWTKDKVPRLKPHPHCMCLIVPRATAVKVKGINDYVKPADSAYDIAKSGGAHAGFLKDRMTHPDAFLQRSLSSIQAQINQHQQWITNPALKLGDLTSYDARQVEALVTKKWPADIKRQQQQADILQGLLNDRSKK